MDCPGAQYQIEGPGHYETGDSAHEKGRSEGTADSSSGIGEGH